MSREFLCDIAVGVTMATAAIVALLVWSSASVAQEDDNSWAYVYCNQDWDSPELNWTPLAVLEDGSSTQVVDLPAGVYECRVTNAYSSELMSTTFALEEDTLVAVGVAQIAVFAPHSTQKSW